MAKMGRPRKPRNPVGRPKGGTDAKKRKTKTFWSGADLKFLRENWDFMKTMDIAKHLNKSQSTIRSTAKELGFKPKYFCRDISRAMQLDDFKGKSGIYGIVNTRSTKVYIGSSVNCYARLQAHLNLLNKGTHYNTVLQEAYNDTFYLVMFEECSESELLAKETEYHHKYSPYCLYNTWSNVENPEDCEFLQTATERFFDLIRFCYVHISNINRIITYQMFHNCCFIITDNSTIFFGISLSTANKTLNSIYCNRSSQYVICWKLCFQLNSP